MRIASRNDRRRRTLGSLLLFASIAAVLVACGSSGAAAPISVGGPTSGGTSRDANGAAVPGGSFAPGTGNGNSGSGNNFQVGGDGSQLAAVDATKIVRTGSLQMTVADVTKALIAGRNAVSNLGGYIGASQQQRSGDETVASVTYRIPVARWEEALDALRALGTEIAEKTDAAEVTGQIVDIAARIRNLRASEAALVGYATNAPKISDLLEIQARLTDTRGEIERLTAQQSQLEDQAALATLTVTYGTEVVAVTKAAEQWDPAAEVDRASATLIGIGQAVASFVIVFVIVWLPVLVGLGVLVVIGLVIARRFGWSGPRRYPPIASPPPSAEA